MEIVEFILTRIEEDEELASAAIDHMQDSPAMLAVVDEENPLQLFVARWNPWRVTALCMLRRHAVLSHRPVVDELGGQRCVTCDDRTGRPGWPCRPLKLLVNEWSEHPEFDSHWALGGRGLNPAV